MSRSLTSTTVADIDRFVNGKAVSWPRAEVGEEAAERLMTGVLPTEGSGFRELHIQQAMVDSSIESLDRAFLPLRPAALEALETQAGAH